MGFHDEVRKQCPFCKGTGISEKGEAVKLVCFHFLVNGQQYCWHQPSKHVDFSYETTKKSSDWDDRFQEKKAEPLTTQEVKSYKDLLLWVIDGADNAKAQGIAA